MGNISQNETQVLKVGDKMIILRIEIAYKHILHFSPASMTCPHTDTIGYHNYLIINNVCKILFQHVRFASENLTEGGRIAEGPGRQ